MVTCTGGGTLVPGTELSELISGEDASGEALVTFTGGGTLVPGTELSELISDEEASGEALVTFTGGGTLVPGTELSELISDEEELEFCSGKLLKLLNLLASELISSELDDSAPPLILSSFSSLSSLYPRISNNSFIL